MALIRIFCLPIFAVRVAPLANVSVVIIACAAASQSEVWSIPKRADFTAETSGAGSSVSPITPVDATNISVSSARRRFASALAVRPAARAPAAPVKALALPALTPNPRMRPPPAARFSRDRSTGADGILDFVKTPATRADLENSASMKSGRPVYFTPVCAAKICIPAIGGNGGKACGAKGETGSSSGMNFTPTHPAYRQDRPKPLRAFRRKYRAGLR